MICNAEYMMGNPIPPSIQHPNMSKSTTKPWFLQCVKYYGDGIILEMSLHRKFIRFLEKVTNAM